MGKILRKKIKNKKSEIPNSKIGLFFLLSFLVILGLFSETVRILPAGSFSDKLQDFSYEIPRLNSSLIEEKLLKKTDYKKIQTQIEKVKTEISKIEPKKLDQEIIVAKESKTAAEEIETKTTHQKIIYQEILLQK